jgi:hypothetical protein
MTIGNDQDYYEMSAQMKSPLPKPPALVHSNSDHKSDILTRRKQAQTVTHCEYQSAEPRPPPPKFPLTGEEVIRNFHFEKYLSPFEKKEILKFSEVYYLGTPEAKETKSLKSLLNTRSNSMNHANNFGFERNNGTYKVIVGDHIAYRYEVIREIDRGAFG